MELIDELAEKLGFYSSYTGTFGEQVFPKRQAKEKLLHAMGLSLDNDSLSKSIHQIDHKEWLNILPASHIAKLEEKEKFILISIPSTDACFFTWKIQTESNEIIEGTTDLNDLAPVSNKTINGQHYTQCYFSLPDLLQGYHKLAIQLENTSSQCDLIFAPSNCYSHKEASKNKVWGYTAQLYSLRSEHNWGIGDFSDLHMLSSQASQLGASLIGLNPLHALFKHNPSHRSPYSPSSRNFLNPIYIDVSAIENYTSCKQAQKRFKSNGFQERLLNCKEQALVDYELVAELKYEIIELLFKDFLDKKNSAYQSMASSFEAFKQSHGEELYQFASFDAFYEYFNEKDQNIYGWQQWPVEYQDPLNKEVKELQIELAERIEYFSFLQWVAHYQLFEAAQKAKKEMPIGLYLDLAVGCDGSGADLWSNKEIYVAGASIGAPPDNLNALGQNWGLTPMNPVALKSQGYQPLISALRSIMQYSGAIRIDHILGLMRQYWVAPEMTASEGLYIHFPFNDILRVIALESRRHKCVVIGEDLGNVPPGFTEQINEAGLLSFKVMFFERWESGLFKRPDSFPEKSIATISTHDTPTLAGWWEGRDLHWRQKLHLYPDQASEDHDKNNREGERHNLIAGLEDWNVIESEKKPALHPPLMNTELSIAVQKYLASSPSHIQLISLEDALEIAEQVNIPGTIDEHPNWLQKLPVMLDGFYNVRSVREISEAMAHIRPRT